MIRKKQLVQFSVQNRTDCGINVPVYKLNVFSINATTKYTWDITSETITCGYGTIIINGVTNSLTWNGTLLGLLTALNALGFGFFCSESSGGNTYIVTFDDTNVYGTLDTCSATTTTTTSTTTAPPSTTTTTTTTSTTTAPPTTTTTTTTTTTLAPQLRTFRINNTDLSNSITLDVQINSVQVITPTLIPANSVITLTPQVDCAGFTNVTLEYQLVAGYTPSSASFSNGSGTYTGTIAGGFITFTGVDLTANTNQDLTVNP